MWKYKEIVKVIGKVNEVFQSIIASFHTAKYNYDSNSFQFSRWICSVTST